MAALKTNGNRTNAKKQSSITTEAKINCHSRASLMLNLTFMKSSLEGRLFQFTKIWHQCPKTQTLNLQAFLQLRLPAADCIIINQKHVMRWNMRTMLEQFRHSCLATPKSVGATEQLHWPHLILYITNEMATNRASTSGTHSKAIILCSHFHQSYETISPSLCHPCLEWLPVCHWSG